MQREVFSDPSLDNACSEKYSRPLPGQRVQREVFSDPSLDNACSEKYSRPLPGQRVQREVFSDPSLDNVCSEKCSQTPPWTTRAARSVPDPSLQGSFVFELGNPDKISWSARNAEVKSVRWTTSRNELTYGKQREIETDTETLRKRLKERSRGGREGIYARMGPAPRTQAPLLPTGPGKGQPDRQQSQERYL